MVSARRLAFTVRGIPVPYALKAGGNVHTSPALKAWKMQVVEEAERAMDGASWDRLVDCPAILMTVFHLYRRPTKRPRKKECAMPIGKPDTEPLLRPVKDALTQAGVWKDDSQVVVDVVGKVWAVKGAEQGPEKGIVGVEVFVASSLDEGVVRDWIAILGGEK